MRRVIVNVRLSELGTQQLDIAPWEVPIMAYTHKEQIEVVGESVNDQRVPLPEEEWDRLEKRYGVDKETHVPRVAMAYGQGMNGMQALRREMAPHLEEQEKLDAAAARAEDERAQRIASGGDSTTSAADAAPSDPVTRAGRKSGSAAR